MRAKRASEKIAYNFNDVTISTFLEMIFRYNFYVLIISTFRILQIDYNFNGIQFQHAREARQRKNVSQFQHICNFYFWTKLEYRQFQQYNNFYILNLKSWVQFQQLDNFYFPKLMCVLQFWWNIISTGARSAPAKMLGTISTKCNFDMRAKRASEKITYNFNWQLERAGDHFAVSRG